MLHGFEVVWKARPHVSQLVSQRFRWIVRLIELAANAVQFIRNKLEFNAVVPMFAVVRLDRLFWALITRASPRMLENIAVPSVIEKSDHLEPGSAEGCVARWISWERRLESSLVAVGRRRSEHFPSRPREAIRDRTGGILPNSLERAPKLIPILLPPAEDSCVRDSNIR